MSNSTYSEKKQCMGCMEFYDSQYDICPHCGYEEDQIKHEMLHMDPGTLLAERYIIGRSLGYGGFGVTYIGWDTQLKRKIAVKEYLPSEFATRMLHKEKLLVANNEKKKQQYYDGLKKFVQEGQKLAKVSNIDGIVRLYDSFEANNTAYIVMEYLEGETLASFLEKGNMFSEKEAINLIMPVLQSLQTVHDKGIIHRDIAPDNIFLTKDRDGNTKVKLIDFGAAKFATTSHSKSLTVIIKPGYSPEEQYRSNGDQGTYTDIYAIAAVLYRMVTGAQPPDAFERRTAIESGKRDLLVEPGIYNKELSANFEIALLNALNIRIEDRTATVEEFIDELISFEPIKRRGSSIRKIDFMRWPLWAKISVPIASVVALALVVFAFMYVFSEPISEYTLPKGMTRVPDLVTIDFNEAKDTVEAKNLLINSVGSQFAPKTEANLILEQDVSLGSIVLENTEINVLLSTGQETFNLPDVTGMNIRDARAALECMGVEVETEESTAEGLAANCVIAQDKEPYSEINYGEIIKLTITGEDEKREGKVPDLSGLTYEEALAKADEEGVSFMVKDKKFSKEVKQIEIDKQSYKKGTTVKDNETLEVTLLLPWREFKMPNLSFKERSIALQLLKNIGITPDVSEEISEVVSKGLVCEQSVEKDEDVVPNQEISIVISKGGKPIEVPDVTGMKEDDARKELTDKKFIVSVEYGYDKNVKEGYVISQNPKKGAEFERGSEILIIVCSKKDLVDVLDVRNLSESEAKEKLTAAELKVRVEEIYSSNVPKGNVIEQLPAPGTVQTKGTTIVITISKGPDPNTVSKTEESGKKEKTYTWSDWTTSFPSGQEYESKTQYRQCDIEQTSSEQSSLSGWTLSSSEEYWTDYGGWSDWSVTPVSTSESTRVESKTQYRYSDKEYTTSTNSSLSGWTQTGSSSNWTDYGGWSNWSESAVSSSESRQVETTTLYGYYYFQCANCGTHMHVYGANACYTWAGGCGNSIDHSSWHQMLSEVSYGTAGMSDWYGTGKYATTYFGGRYFKWNDHGNNGMVTGYRYRDRQKITTYSYERWGNWSNWSDSAYQSSSTRKVESQNVYRYSTRNKKTIYYYERATGDYSEYQDTPIYENGYNVVQTRTVYRYKIYN